MDEGHRTPEPDNDRNRRTFLEETASEFTEPVRNVEREDDVQHAYGWIALALSIISFFFLPVLFAIACVILGIVARNRPSLLLVYSDLVVVIISLIIQLFILSYFYLTSAASCSLFYLLNDLYNGT